MRLPNSQSALLLLLLLGAALSACTASQPSVKEASYPGRSKGDLVDHVVRSLASGGYEIRNKDEAAGIVQAFRLLKGAIMRPGYGHNVTVAIQDTRLKVTVFPAEGVIGGPSVEDVQAEIARLLGGA